MSLSQSQLRLLSSVGVGILVGTSLIVIIPEGIEAATAPAEAAHMHRVRSLVRRTPWSHAVLKRGLPESIVTISTGSIEKRNDELDTEALVRRIINAAARNGRVKRADIEAAIEATGDDAPAIPGAGDAAKDSTTDNKGSEKAESGKEGQQNHDGDHEAEHDHDHEHEHEQEHEKEEAHEHAVPTFEIGFSLILGFLLMFLIDRLPRHATESLHSTPQTRHISLDNLNGDSASVDEEADGFLGSLTPTPRRARSLATTTGLVIHAAADGIAMGASSTTSDMKLGFIIFAAIMIHKAPAAFGLTSLLLKQGLSKRAARGHPSHAGSALPARDPGVAHLGEGRPRRRLVGGRRHHDLARGVGSELLQDGRVPADVDLAGPVVEQREPRRLGPAAVGQSQQEARHPLAGGLAAEQKQVFLGPVELLVGRGPDQALVGIFAGGGPQG